mgnify:FL=1
MPVGKELKEKIFRYTDTVSGRPIARLTSYLGHSNLLYFTDPYWIDEGSFVFCSDRDGFSNLFRYDLEGGRVIQLTDLVPPEGEDFGPNGAYRTLGYTWKKKGRHYFWYGPVLYELELENGKIEALYEAEPGWSPQGFMVSVSADGKRLFTGIRQGRTTATEAARLPRYDKSPDYYTTFETRPLSRIISVDIEGGRIKTVWEEENFLTLVNAIPRRPNLLTVCHEGPWAKVEQRIWGLDTETGRVWKIRPQEGPDRAAIGHEYWFADGDHVGYHGRRLPGEETHFVGFCAWDNSSCTEYDFLPHCSHVGGRDGDLFILDGRPANVQPWFTSDRRPYIMLVRRKPGNTGGPVALPLSSAGNGVSGVSAREPGFSAATAEYGAGLYEGPRVLALHRSTFNGQFAHPHAALTPDGTKVIFTSDMEGYSQIYLAEIGDFETLPPVP